jgi:hypothetical protein
VLVGRATIHDGNLAALAMIMAEWSRPDLGFADRVSHLRTGGAGALNGIFLLDDPSLIDDAVANVRNGGPGSNLLL